MVVVCVYSSCSHVNIYAGGKGLEQHEIVAGTAMRGRTSKFFRVDVPSKLSDCYLETREQGNGSEGPSIFVV